jgi:Mg-chelatase subunit ChlD
MLLDSDTSRRELKKLATTDRYSEKRRKQLERLANVLTEPDIDIAVKFQDTGAFSRQGGDNAPHDFEIHIPVEKTQQIDTKLSEHVWDRRLQVGILFHELGHVFYSDFEQYEQRAKEVDREFQEQFRTFCNAAEDVAIEAQLASEFELEDDFRTLNNTFTLQQHRDQQRYVNLFSEVDCFQYTLFEAIEIGLLSFGFGTDQRFESMLSGEIDTFQIHNDRDDLLESVAPLLRCYIEDMLSIPDGTERVERAYRFFEETKPIFEKTETVQRVRIQTETFRPVEAGKYVIQSPEEASNLSGGTPTGSDSSGLDPSVETGEEQPTVGERKPAESSQESVDSLLIDVDGDENSPAHREANRLLDIIQSEDSEIESVEIAEPDGGSGNMARWEEAGKRAAQLTADLRTALRRRRRSTLSPGRRSGQIDPQRIVRAAQGQDRIFRQRIPGDERDYSCLIILDRSGSMSVGVTSAEDATAQLVRAFHAVGVDVSVLSLLQSKPRLELPFGGEPQRYAGHLLSEHFGGSTPLSAAIEIARERVSEGAGHQPFIIVVTDGYPDDAEQYEKEIQRCNFDVYGIYLGKEPGDHARYFDRIIYSSLESIDRTLRQLARNLLD